MDSQVLAWLALAAAAISNGLTVWNFVQSPSRAAAAAVVKLTELVVAQDKRIQALEAELRHLPSKDSVNELKLTIAHLEGVIGRLEEQLTAVSATVRRVDDFLRAQK